MAFLPEGSPGGLGVPSSNDSYDQPLSNKPKEKADQIAASTKTEISDVKSPESTDDIPMPNQNRTEQRTIGNYMKDRMGERFNNNPKIQSAKRTYNLSRNTTENWINKIKKRGPES